MGNIARGGYVIYESGEVPEVILIATGSEVSLAVAAAKQLDQEGRRARVVSMPSVEVFEAQDAGYQESVLPAGIRQRVAIEASHVDYWRKWVGLDGKVVGMNSFGASAPGGALFEHFGFTLDAIVQAARDLA